jgi:hypothetical protein
MPSKVDAKYVKEVEALFETLIDKVKGTGLVSETSFALLGLMQRNAAANFYKNKLTLEEVTPVVLVNTIS